MVVTRRMLPALLLIILVPVGLGANPAAAGAASASTGDTAMRATWPEAAGSPEALIGLDPPSALARLGPPESLATARGSEPWQDDAVFVYPYGLRLSWYGSRVWQVHASGASAPAMLGLKPGDSIDKALSLLGEPDYGELPGDSGRAAWEWKLPSPAWPLRLRVLARAGILEDLYVYRSDF